MQELTPEAVQLGFGQRVPSRSRRVQSDTGESFRLAKITACLTDQGQKVVTTTELTGFSEFHAHSKRLVTGLLGTSQVAGVEERQRALENREDQRASVADHCGLTL